MKRSVVVLLALPLVVASQVTPTEAAEGGGAILRVECLPNDPVHQQRIAEEEAARAEAEAKARQAAEQARREAEAAARRRQEEERRQVSMAKPEADPEPRPEPSPSPPADLRDPFGGTLGGVVGDVGTGAVGSAEGGGGVSQGATGHEEARRRAEEDARRAAESQARHAAEAARKAEEERRYKEAYEAEQLQAAEAAAPALPPANAPEEPMVTETLDTTVVDIPAPSRPVATSPEQTWDWGASLFLSNDDSMSLASAQRVLYALKRGVALDAADVRPHELLNYFSFDTVEPRPGETFALAAAAEAQGDTLAMTMAVQGAEPERRPLDLTTVVDVSGSMRSDGRLETVQRALHLVEEQLVDGDRFDLVTFSNHQCVALEDFVVGRDDPSLLRRAIDGMAPTGGTNLNAGLDAGYELAVARHGQERNQRVMLLTDANLNVGVTDHGIVADVARAYEDLDIRLTGVGVGRGFNDAFLDKLTDSGKGAYVYLGSDAVVDRLFGVGFPSLVETVAHDVQFELELPDSLAMERFYGEEVSTVAADVQPIHYYAGTSQVFFQDLHMGEVRPKDRVRLTVRYTDALTGKEESQRFETTVGDLLDADPRNVHKAQALMAFSDVVMDQAMGADPCPSMASYSRRAALLSDDAEIGYVNSLLDGVCPELAAPVSYKLSFQTDRPLANASLDCGGDPQGHVLSASDTVARFQARPGTCVLEVSDGAERWTASVSVPAVDGGARCVVRGRRLSCR